MPGPVSNITEEFKAKKSGYDADVAGGMSPDEARAKWGLREGGVGIGDTVGNAISDVYNFGKQKTPSPQDPNMQNFLLPGYEQTNAQIAADRARALGQQAPQMGMSNQFRNGQEALIGQLQRQASGQGPSLAGMQVREQAGRNIAQQQALAASALPGQSAMAARMAAQNTGRINTALAGQGAQAMLQERLGAQNALGGLLAGARGQDIGVQQANLTAQLQQQGLTNEQIINLLHAQQVGQSGQQAGTMGYEAEIGRRYAAQVGAPQQPGLGQLVMGGLADIGASWASRPGGK